MRPHLSLDVRDVSASVAFYQKVFGVAPQKQTTDYAKFDLSEPAVVQITPQRVGASLLLNLGDLLRALRERQTLGLLD